MRGVFKLLGFIAFTFTLLLVVAVVAFYHLIHVGEFRRFLTSAIERQTDLRVQLGEADLEIGWISGIVFRDLTVSLPESPQQVITAERATARVALLPLLRRELLFYEVRFRRPFARLERGRDGKMPLLDRLLNLPVLKEQERQFTLDLRSIKIESGEVEFTDQGGTAREREVTTRLRAADIDVERIRGTASGEFARGMLKTSPAQPQGVALAFSLRGEVEREGNKTTARAKGRLFFLGENLELDKAWWDADLQSADLPAAMLQSYTSGRLPVKSLTGVFLPRLRIEGNPSERLRVKGELSFKRLAVDAPQWFAGPLNPDDGKIDLEVDWTPRRLEIAQMVLRSKEIGLSLRGEVRGWDNNETHLQLTLSVPFVPVVVVRKYLPLKMIAATPLEHYAATLQEGELRVKKAGVNAKLSDLRRIAQAGFDDRVWFDAELSNVSANLSDDGYLPLRAVQGEVTLEKGVLTLKSVKGYYGQSRLTDLDGSYRRVSPGQGVLQLRGRGDIDLGEMREQLKLKLLPAKVANLATAVKELGGKGRFDLALHRAADSPFQIEGKVALDNARLRTDDLTLTELRGEITVSPKAIKAEKARGLASGSPIQIDLALNNYLTDQGSFDLAIDSTGVRAGVVTRLLLASGSLQDPGIVRGSVHFRGPFEDRGKRTFTGDLDLFGVQLNTPPLLQPLRELSGKIRIDETGIDFQNLKGLLTGFPVDFNGRWRFTQKPQLIFELTSPNLDISYLLSQLDPQSTDFYANLQAEGKLAIHKGRIRAFEFSGLKSDVAIERRVWRLGNVTIRSGSGTAQGRATIADKPDTLGFSAEPKIQGIPMQSFLAWFDMATTELTGKVNLNGHFESTGKDGPERQRNLNGAFNLRIEDGTTRRLGIAARILNLLDLSRWFTLQLPDFNKQGVHFRSITGDFKIVKGVYSTQNLVLDSDDLRMTGAGIIDVPRDEIDFVVAVRPFPGMDTAINYIPLIGRGIAAVKNSFLVASFNVKGPIEDPTITPAPLSTLSEVFFSILGIPKNLIPFVGEERKEEPQRDQTKEPAKAKAPPTR